uniref:Uncharacterized protein n=1 Tax=Arundo donax TaxID=35708 RepID=A0A0A8YM95_ARUDO
MKQFLSTNSI